ncbi:MAG: hypothetical protein QXI39_06635 [Candidatus Bathyarchaeia archaeon]
MGEGEKEEVDEVLSGVRGLLKELEIETEDFHKKIRGKYAAHEKVIEALRKKWLETRGFGRAKAPYVPPGGTYGIDFLGRDFERGRIILAVEVDSWPKAIVSWQKLADIRAPYKIWIYLARDERAQLDFKFAIYEIINFLRSRDERRDEFGNLVVFMKGPKDVFREEVIFTESNVLR